MIFVAGMAVGVFLGVFGTICCAVSATSNRRRYCGQGHYDCNGRHPRED